MPDAAAACSVVEAAVLSGNPISAAEIGGHYQRWQFAHGIGLLSACIMTGALMGLAFHVRRSRPTLGLIGGALAVVGAIGLGAGFAIDGFTWGTLGAISTETRVAPGSREQIPKGAYVPFGGGSRTCIGMRFGQQEIRTIATAILERFNPELAPGYELEVRQMPTIGPKHGLPVILRALYTDRARQAIRRAL